jgi:hypothetical protein
MLFVIGKDGMSYHVTHVQTVDENGDPDDFNFLHIIEQNKQVNLNWLTFL